MFVCFLCVFIIGYNWFLSCQSITAVPPMSPAAKRRRRGTTSSSDGFFASLVVHRSIDVSSGTSLLRPTEATGLIL